MSFVSLVYLGFFFTFGLIYFRLRTARAQNILIIVGSYLFYAYWDWRLLGLLVTSSCVDFWVGRALEPTRLPRRRKLLLAVSIGVNLAMLGAFKYFGFFVDSLQRLFHSTGLFSEPSTVTLEIVLPIGISFYTFQTMGYTIDVYRNRVSAIRKPSLYFAFVCFFPQLVAGPIERAERLMPGLEVSRRFTQSDLHRGLRLILYGYFVKVVLADSAAPIVDSVYVDDQPYGWSVIFGTALFALQIYADFYGYSLIARGSARVLGIRLSRNFLFPYWSVSLVDFWRRWHITLSTWFRDYVYIPLGGNRRGGRRRAMNLMVTASLAGLWHGAAWHFVVWGALHGIGLVVAHSRAPERRLPSTLGWILTQGFVLGTWLVFRASDLVQARMLLASLANLEWAPVHSQMVLALIVLSTPLLVVEGVTQLSGGGELRWPDSKPWMVAVQSLMLASIIIAGQSARQSFIYFQF